VALRTGAGIDPRVAGAVGDEVLVQPVIRHEGQEAVLAAPAADDAVEAEPVRLDDVDVVEVRELHGEVPQVDPVSTVGPEDVELAAVALHQDVRRSGAGALDLEAALVVAVAVAVRVPDDRDEVLGIRAAALVGVARHEDGRGRGGNLEARAGRVRVRLGAARLLAVDAREDQDARPARGGVDRLLDVPEAAGVEEAQVRRADAPVGDPRDAGARIGLADHEARSAAPILRDGSLARIGEEGGPLQVRRRRARPGERDRGERERGGGGTLHAASIPRPREPRRRAAKL
jgi:hypothetical protein